MDFPKESMPQLHLTTQRMNHATPFRILEQVGTGAEKSIPMFLTPEIMGKPRRGGDGNARVRSGGRGVHRSGSPVRDRLLAATGEKGGGRFSVSHVKQVTIGF